MSKPQFEWVARDRQHRITVDGEHVIVWYRSTLYEREWHVARTSPRWLDEFILYVAKQENDNGKA